jgi:bifunctional non-homologous end joining protein LigD
MAAVRQKSKTTGNAARFIPPMRPRMVSTLPADSSKWLYEPKLDGYRAIAVKNGGTASLFSMEGRVFNDRFPHVLAALDKLPLKDVVLDGEVVAVEPSGRPNFNELQNAARTKLPIHYIAFDVLHHRGVDLLDLPLEERKAILGEVAAGFTKPMQQVLVFPSDIDLDTVIATVKHVKIEGVVAKRKGSKYEPGKEVDFWQKQRFNQEDKFFLGGYIPGTRGVGELLIGEFRDDGKLYFIKRLIAGLSPFNRKQIYDAVQDLKTSKVPFVNLPEKGSEHQHAVTDEVMRQSVWLKPEQQAEIEFIERTPHRRLRHASFRRLLPRSGEK